MSTRIKHQRKRYKAEHMFDKFMALNGLVDAGGEYAKDGRSAKKAGAQVWTKRYTSPSTAWNPKNAKAGVCTTK